MSLGRDFRRENLQWLCKPCHKKAMIWRLDPTDSFSALARFLITHSGHPRATLDAPHRVFEHFTENRRQRARIAWHGAFSALSKIVISLLNGADLCPRFALSCLFACSAEMRMHAMHAENSGSSPFFEMRMHAANSGLTPLFPTSIPLPLLFLVLRIQLLISALISTGVYFIFSARGWWADGDMMRICASSSIAYRSHLYGSPWATSPRSILGGRVNGMRHSWEW